MRTQVLAAGALFLMAGAPAFADSLAYGSFTGTEPGLTYAGQATASGGSLVLTPQAQFAAGAAYTNTALALGASPNFSSTFTFNIKSAPGVVTANGFAFVLSSNPAGYGTSNQSLGLTNATSLAIEFSDFGNKNLNPLVSPGVYNSNLVAAIQNGNTNVQSNSPFSYGSPGPSSCVGTQVSGNGCMNNGDVWTASITYANGLLNVALKDGAGGFVSVISNYAITLASSVYAGFTGSTGAFYQSVDIDSWSLTSNSVPEPMTVGMFGVGIAALGYIRSRRRSV